ncbi:hypothetical protein AB0A99_25205 [Streptomyces fradiae]|uniref:hypothetical protein n=1 Tax=Streptomyces fradiae TaxID=1906 RepID=UPI0033C4AD1D
MRRAGLVAVATTALTLGAAGQSWATTSTGDVAAGWGDRARLRVTWVDRTSFEGGSLAVTDRTCDGRSFYATLTLRTGSGAVRSLGERHHTGGCGTRTVHGDIAAGDASGVRGITMTLCRTAAGAADECETRYLSANPYHGF